MGVDKASYLLYGFKIEKKEEQNMKTIDDHYEDLMESENYGSVFNCDTSEQTIVYDYICGNYIYIGLRIAKLYEEDCEGESIEIQDSTSDLKERLMECMNNWPDYLLDIVKNKEPKLYFFIHCY